jgi:hypothetical protein
MARVTDRQTFFRCVNANWYYIPYLKHKLIVQLNTEDQNTSKYDVETRREESVLLLEHISAWLGRHKIQWLFKFRNSPKLANL